MFAAHSELFRLGQRRDDCFGGLEVIGGRQQNLHAPNPRRNRGDFGITIGWRCARTESGGFGL